MNSASSPQRRKGPLCRALSPAARAIGVVRRKSLRPALPSRDDIPTHSPSSSRRLLKSLLPGISAYHAGLSRTTLETGLCSQSCSLAGLPSPAGRGPQTTSSSSPFKDAPLSLGELLTCFSEMSKSWLSSRGGLEAAAAPFWSSTRCCWMSI